VAEVSDAVVTVPGAVPVDVDGRLDRCRITAAETQTCHQPTHSNTWHTLIAAVCLTAGRSGRIFI